MRRAPILIALVATWLTASSPALADAPPRAGHDQRLAEQLALPHATVMARAKEEAALKTRAHVSAFQLDKASWSLSQDTGVIVFTTPKGLQVSAAVQIVGTYSNLDGTWLWSWDNPSIDRRLTRDAQLTRQYGTRRGLPELTTRKLEMSTDRAWELTALAGKLAGAQGALGVKDASGGRVFVTFGTLKAEKATAPAP